MARRPENPAGLGEKPHETAEIERLVQARRTAVDAAMRLPPAELIRRIRDPADFPAAVAAWRLGTQKPNSALFGALSELTRWRPTDRRFNAKHQAVLEFARDAHDPARARRLKVLAVKARRAP